MESAGDAGGATAHWALSGLILSQDASKQSVRRGPVIFALICSTIACDRPLLPRTKASYTALQDWAMGEGLMNLKIFVTAFAAAAAVSLLAAPADAATKKRVVRSGGHTVFVSRDEDGFRFELRGAVEDSP